MMTQAAIHKAATLIADAFRKEHWIEKLPKDIRPENREDGYAIQKALVPMLGMVGGWKGGVSSETDEGMFSPVPASRVLKSPGRLPFHVFQNPALEGEIGVILAHDLPLREKPYSEKEISEAVASVHPVIEIIDSRFRHPDDLEEGERVADLLLTGALVVGPAFPTWTRASIKAPAVTVSLDGVQVRDVAKGGNFVSPFLAVSRLAAHCARHGIPLKGGHVIATGNRSSPVVPMQAGHKAVVSFEGLGDVSVRF